MSNIKTQIGKIIGKTLNSYHDRVKPKIDELKFKEEYQGRIIDCMVGEVDDNYIETPETDENIVKLEHSKEGVIKIPQIKGKTILVDADGNETDTPAEGCRLVSVGEEEDNKLIILSKNKNLLTSKFENGNMGNSGEEYDQAEYIRSNTYNKCSENMNIIVSYNTVFRFSQLFFFDENKNFLKRETVINSIVPKGAKYFRVVLAKKDGSLATNNDLELANSSTQVEFNVKATSYVEPKQHKTEILLNEPLRKINNDIYDEIKEKEVIYRVGHTIFNGEEHWYTTESYGLQNAEGYISFYSNKLYNKTPNSKGYKCNLFNYKGYDSGFRQTLDFEGISDGGGYYMTFVRIKKERLETNDVEGFKNYLKNNPMKVLYVYKEPIIEELPNGITLQGFDDTTMYIENSITPTVSYGYNALIPYKEELRTQKEEVETNTLDIENNIIPYLMDMEYNLMLMEDN